MAFQLNVDDDATILVELRQAGRGEQDVAISPADIAKKSMEALNNAMTTLYSMSRRTVATVKQIPIPDRPSSVEVEFSIKLTTDAKAFIVSAEAEGQITVKLIWKNILEEKSTEKK